MANIEAELAAAHLAFADRDWDAALDHFLAADASGGLPAEELLATADAAFWSGRTPVALEVVQRAHAALAGAGAFVAAADAALLAVRLHATQGGWAVAAGWLERARRYLRDIPECAAHAHLAYVEAHACLAVRDYEGAAAGARDTEAIAVRTDDRDFVVLARAMQGFTAMHTGDLPLGRRLLDESLAIATAGEVGMFASAEIFCEMVVANLDVADYQRAVEWLEEAERLDLVSFPGCCRVHRTTVLRHRGAWDEARQSATQALSEVAGIEASHEGMALTEIGELHRYRGELTLAEQAFNDAYEKGWLPQPGLSLARLAAGDVDGAARMINRSVDSAAYQLAALVSLLPAQVEIAIAAGDLSGAQSADDRLDEVAEQLATSAAAAAAHCVRGELLRQHGDFVEAARELSLGIRGWQDAREPYETARARLRLAEILEASADPQSARLELRTARGAFEHLGASVDAANAARMLGEEQPRHAARVFMFTDVVDSTQLLSTIGDDAWHSIQQWHDRTATAIFTDHHGDIVKHTGDGFFAVFDQEQLAVDAAIAFQRALAAQRRKQGFAPSVRIGLHSGSAVVNGHDYMGADVNIAARIGSIAGAHEILMSAAVSEHVKTHVRVGPPAPRVLKGIPGPVLVCAVDWR